MDVRANRPSSQASREGAVVLLMALGLGLVLGLLGLVIDGGVIYLARQRSQAAADSAALAAAADIPHGMARMSLEAETLAGRNRNSRLESSLALTYPYLADPTRVEAVHTCYFQPLFLGLVGVGRLRIADRAVAQYRAANTAPGPFSLGPFGRSHVSFWAEGFSDSYDSSAGTYSSQVVSGHAGPGGVRTNGNVRVGGAGDIFGDVTAPGTIILNSVGSIYGNVSAGGDTSITGNVARIVGDLTTNETYSGPGTGVTGTVTEHSTVVPATVALPDVSVTGAAASNDNGTIPPSAVLSSGSPPSLTIGDSTVTLATGTYYLKNLTLSGRGNLNVAGPVAIYMTGQLLLTIGSSGGVNVGGSPPIPARMKIYASGAHEGPHEFGSTGEFHGGLYSPNMGVHLGGDGSAYGSIVAGYLDLDGKGAIHLDRNFQASVPEDSPQVYRLTE